MPEPSWGIDDPPGPFRSADGVADADSDDVNDVPAVAEARTLGYFPAHEAPLWCFIPAIWPSAARAWTPDVRIRHKTRGATAGSRVFLPWSAYDHFSIEDETNLLLARVGLPPRPGGRIWLLKPPPGYDDLDAVLQHVWTSWRSSGGEDLMTPEFVAHAQRELGRLFSQA